MTHAQRFDITSDARSVYAPFSWGCPSMRFATDYSVFKKIPGEKEQVKDMKKELGKTKHHKFETIMHASL